MIKPYKKLTSIFLTLILLFNFISPISMVKANENSNEKTDYKFSFDIYRGSLSKYENLFAVYSNYYMNHPEFDVFDRDEWALKDFEIEYELHTHTGKSIIKKMSYTSED